MAQANSSLRENEAPTNGESEVDEYTAKMDRMLSDLKQRSQKEHNRELHAMLIWVGVGIVVTAAAIYLMLNVASDGVSLGFLSR